MGQDPIADQIIYHQEKAEQKNELGERHANNRKQIEAHIESFIGEVSHVFHEILSDQLSIDILCVSPTKARNYYTLVTCGMSSLPMTVPQGAEDFRYAELMLCLPPNWKLSDEAFQKEENYWPIRTMKFLARLPHDYASWLYLAHTIPNGDPAEPYASNTMLTGMMLTVPTIVPQIKEFFNLVLSDEQTVHFYGLIPLYTEEMEYKLKHGGDALMDKLSKAGVTEKLDPHRKNVCKKSFWIF